MESIAIILARNSQELEVPFFQHMAQAESGAHQAHECAFDEKHPIRRVGDAEGARGNDHTFDVCY
jgi:hypothetical protein